MFIRKGVVFIFDLFALFQEDDVNISKDERHVRCLSPNVSLFVYECMELALNVDKEENFDDSSKPSSESGETKEECYTVKLFHGK